MHTERLVTSAMEETDTMASFLPEVRQGSCYCCHRSAPSEAYGATICRRHHALLSLKLCVLLARRGQFGPFWHSHLARITHCPGVGETRESCMIFQHPGPQRSAPTIVARSLHLPELASSPDVSQPQPLRTPHPWASKRKVRR